LQLAGLRVLLFVGRMARNKRLIDMVEALALVRQHYPDTCLVLVGDNQHAPYAAYVQEVQQRASDLGCGEYVLFIGQVADLAPYYQRCDVYVTASVHEGFCLPVIEAMAVGKPVVAADATALPETVNGGGLLFAPGDVADMAAKIMLLFADDAVSVSSSVLPASSVPFSRRTSVGKVRAGVSRKGAKTQNFGQEMVFPNGVQGEKGSLERTSLPRDIIGEKPIVFVTLRYGDEIVGGSERLMRGWAEQLAQRGYAVELLTTCVHDLFAWRNQLPPGVEQVNGVTVRRFLIDEGDAQGFHTVQAKAVRGEYVSYRDERRFMQQNLRSRAMEAYLQAHADAFACVLFAPYLFGTTYWGMQAVAEKAIIVPCLHQEPVAHFQIVREMLEAASGLLFNTVAERELATGCLQVKNPAQAIVGYGFDPLAPLVDGEWFRRQYGLSHFLLYSGRLEDGKNVPLLLDYFTRYKAEYPDCMLALVLTGVGSMQSQPNDHSDIHFLGTLPEHALPALFAAAFALCQPSLYESFSIVLMESWLQGRPVLVHAECPVTSEHVAASGGGFTFDDYASFRDTLNYLLDNPSAADEAGQRGRSYVLEQYTWQVVTERLLQGITSCLAPRSTYQQLARRGVQHALQYTPARFQDVLLQLVEQAEAERGMLFTRHQQEQLRSLQHVGMPGYEVCSQVPFVGRLIAWVRRQLTSHLKEPYLDPIVARQEEFNREMVQTLVPAVEQSMYEQRRLRREVAMLRERLAEQEEHRV
jgi:glycosyltransferase involved in cell wall biosynthesis